MKIYVTTTTEFQEESKAFIDEKEALIYANEILSRYSDVSVKIESYEVKD